jgi:hypothetical protein
LSAATSNSGSTGSGTRNTEGENLAVLVGRICDVLCVPFFPGLAVGVAEIFVTKVYQLDDVGESLERDARFGVAEPD